MHICSANIIAYLLFPRTVQGPAGGIKMNKKEHSPK